jgi:hypothetical protein
MEILLCPKCGWTHDMVGMKNECPECKSHLHILKGTKEEIDDRIKEITTKELQ